MDLGQGDGLAVGDPIAEQKAATTTGGSMWREAGSLPNLLTLARIGLAPLVLVYFPDIKILILIAIVAAVTDFLDGYIARKFNMATRLGGYLDPIADKVFILCFLIGAIINGRLHLWQSGLLVIRDVYVSIATAAYIVVERYSPKKVEVRSRMAGKLCTVAQFLAIGAMLLAPGLLNLAIALVALTSAVAIADYTLFFYRASALEPGEHSRNRNRS